MEEITHAILDRGDLAHVALFLWAMAASAGCLVLLRELAAANRRFNAFVTEIAHLNRLFSNKD